MATSREAIVAKLTWPVFSLASFRILQSLKLQGFRFDTIIDGGANIGQFGIAAAKIFPSAKVISIEPAPESFAQLSKNVATIKNIRAENFALGDRTGSINFNVNKHSHSSSVLELDDKHRTSFQMLR